MVKLIALTGKSSSLWMTARKYLAWTLAAGSVALTWTPNTSASGSSWTPPRAASYSKTEMRTSFSKQSLQSIRRIYLNFVSVLKSPSLT